MSNFRWLRDRKIGSGILSSSGTGGTPPLVYVMVGDVRSDTNGPHAAPIVVSHVSPTREGPVTNLV